MRFLRQHGRWRSERTRGLRKIQNRKMSKIVLLVGLLSVFVGTQAESSLEKGGKTLTAEDSVHVVAEAHASGGNSQSSDNDAECTYFLFPYSQPHLFNKIDIHTTYMQTYSSPLYVVIHILLHTLIQAIMHTYVTLEPQAKSAKHSSIFCEFPSNKVIPMWKRKQLKCALLLHPRTCVLNSKEK